MLRLLLAGHDAKSVARALGISVHTVNDRLRDARRKLGVSSSREAARLLAEAEQQGPQFLGAKKLGVGNRPQGAGGPENLGSGPHFHGAKKIGLAEVAAFADGGQAARRKGAGPSLVWLAGGLIVIAVIVATFMPPFALQDGRETPVQRPPAAGQAAQEALDLMPIADSNGDGKVTADEYEAFSEQGWEFVSQGQDQVRWTELDDMERVSFLGIVPNAEGAITRQMYVDAIPGRFTMFDRNRDGTLSSDEINGRAFQR